MPALPTQEKLIEQIEARKAGDQSEFAEYLKYLQYDHAKPFLKPEVTKESWVERTKPHDREAIATRMYDLMNTAWEGAAKNKAGLVRTALNQFVALMWLAGDSMESDLTRGYISAGYKYCGKDVLVDICKIYGWDSKQWDDGRRDDDAVEET